MNRFFFIITAWLIVQNSYAQNNNPSLVWRSDNGNGTYKNPVINADYSDPDAVRVGNDFYMISSSFAHAPGLPILHSKDLVNWQLTGYALENNVPVQHFKTVQHGGGVWAPSIRYHKGEFYIFYPDPDFGIYYTKSKLITGPWSTPHLVEAGKGLIDPCPFWDDNGKAYLAYALAGSRAGVKSILLLKEMHPAATHTIGKSVLVYDGHILDPTIEGPKVYKRNGYYYLFAPAGGVSTGWQLVLRSKNIWGPYERKNVMHQGSTTVNGPHQGAWVNTPSGEDWFLHFQDKDAYGRVVHLQPMKWIDNWPVIGIDKTGSGTGEPVMVYKKPNLPVSSITTPPDTDEFNSLHPGLQWQWQANPQPHWAFNYNGALRLFSALQPDTVRNLWDAPYLFMQKLVADKYTVTTKLNFYPTLTGEKTGLIVFGTDYAYVAIEKKEDGNYIQFAQCKKADKGTAEILTSGEKISGTEIYFRVSITEGAFCSFSYSTDNVNFKNIGTQLKAMPGRWVGAKVGLFSNRKTVTNNAGYTDVDWFRATP